MDHPCRQGDMGCVPHVAATSMEGEDDLKLEPRLLDHVEQMTIAVPLILARFAFNGAPLRKKGEHDVESDIASVGCTKLPMINLPKRPLQPRMHQTRPEN